MPKKSVLGHPDNVPSLAREGFSLDQVFTFTASTGMLLPVWQDFLNPGETLKGCPNFLLRSDAFLSPAMADIDCFCDLFFVPMHKILSSFGEWLFQIDDIRTDFIDLNDFTEYLPICKSITSSKNPFAGFAQSSFQDYLFPDLRPGRMNSQRFDSFGFGLYRLMYHLGFNPQSIFYGIYNTYGWQDEESTSAILSDFQSPAQCLDSPNFSPYMFAAYQGIYYDIYRNSEFESNNIKAYNLDSIFNNGQGELSMDAILSSRDPLGRRGLFDLRYRWRGKDYFTATRSTPLINDISMMPGARANLAKVNQWLSAGSYTQYNPNLATPQSVDFGYNAVSQYGINLSSSDLDVELSGQPAASIEDLSVDDAYLYHRSDPTVSFESSSGSVVFARDPDDPTKASIRAQQGESSIPTMMHKHGLSGAVSVNRGSLDADLTGGVAAVLTTARVRTMFALEKLARITQRAGKHYDSQVLAHFGFKVNQGMSGEVYKIGSWRTTIGIQKVTATAATQDAALGEQAGVGYAVLDGSKKQFEFTAPCHGIVMAIWSCAPRYKYIFTQDKLNYKTKLWDFFKPSLDNLGSQPLFAYEFSPETNGTGVATGVSGWQWRFMESKVKFNRVSPVFATTGKNPWSFVALPETYENCGFVSPCDLNLLINTQYNPAPAWPEVGTQQDHVTKITSFPTSLLRDPFTIDFYMDCTKVSTMSTFGDTPLNGI